VGFSVAAAGGVLLVGLMVGLTTLTQAYMHSQQGVQDAVQVAEGRLLELRQSGFTIDDVNQANGRLWVNATNTGAVTFNLAKFDLVVDGVVRTSSITAKTVEGATTNVWPPVTQLLLAADHGAAPASVQLVAPNGAQAFWRS
jgi:archaellum component FlaF (FlaF/FlaG flagellin family)